MIDLTRDGEVFVLRMHDGQNTFNRPFMDALNKALDEVEASEGQAALVTTGDERFYSTGLDLQWLATVPAADVRLFLTDLHRLLGRILVFPMATVAALNGHAFAGGAMLALAHDFRVMRADRGYFCLPEVDLAMGLPLTPGMSAVVESRLSKLAAHEALITGRRYGAAGAVTRGMVHEAVPEAELLPRALELARGLAAKDRASVAAIKRGLFASALETLAAPLPDWIAS